MCLSIGIIITVVEEDENINGETEGSEIRERWNHQIRGIEFFAITFSQVSTACCMAEQHTINLQARRRTLQAAMTLLQ